ncbi:tyrosine-type recombinase/integrase [Hespellia stercorisuis]
MEKYKKGILKTTTYENYMLNIRVHVCGTTVGQSPLSKVTTDMLQQYYNEKLSGDNIEEKPLSRRTVEYLHTIIGGALQQAYRNCMITRNVNQFTVLPKKDESEINPLTISEVHKLLQYAKNTELYPLIVLEVFTGMRKGEILGLLWENIDLEKQVLYVRKNLCRVKNDEKNATTKYKLVLLEPKTKKSVRAIPLTNYVVEVLKQQKSVQCQLKEKYKEIYRDNDIVFATADGNFRDPRTLLRDFHKILDDAGVRRCRFHDLRHTFASMLINEGESMKVIQELLGHSTITTTMDVYSHVNAKTKERSIGVLEKVIEI